MIPTGMITEILIGLTRKCTNVTFSTPLWRLFLHSTFVYLCNLLPKTFMFISIFRYLNYNFSTWVFKWRGGIWMGGDPPSLPLSFPPTPSFPSLFLLLLFSKGFNVILILLNWWMLQLNNHHRHLCPPLTVNLSNKNKLVVFIYSLLDSECL